ncbi:MAG: sugar transferase [Caldilineales bacterium]|nr:sugar transferase [Caldilineales bacterium]
MLRREEDANFIIFTYLSDLLLTMMALTLAYIARITLPYGAALTPDLFRFGPVLYITIGAIWTLIVFLLNAYDARHTLRAVDELQSLLVTIGLSAFVFAGVLYLSYRDLPRLLFVYFVLLQLTFLILYRWTMRLGLRWAGARKLSPRRILVIGAGHVGRTVGQRIQEEAWTGLELVGYLDDDPAKIGQTYAGGKVFGPLSLALEIVGQKQVDEVIFALPLRAHEALRSLVLALQEYPVRVRVVPDVLDLAFFRASMEDWDGIPLIGLREPAISGFNRIIKRIFDLVVASLSLLVIWPVMLITAVAIRLDSPGPIILKQQRVGENGRLFYVYKFRSMVQDADKRQHEVLRETPDGQIIHKHRDDPRVTRVGRIIRRLSIDELPQLFNVLKGEMSMVGPRPELPMIVARYEAWQHKRFAVPPGITGWWQVSGRSDKPMHLHTEDDLYYITHYSPLLDLQILWRTIGVVLKGKGAF